jgi:hypothetical protein
VAQHPFRSAWETRDLDAWMDALTPDVVLHSPVIRTPFVGREAAAELYGVLFETLGRVELTHEFTSGDTHAFFWLADAAGTRIEGADLLRFNDRGKIYEVRVLIRPLVGIGAFAAAAGPPLARRRSRARGLVLELLTVPLRWMFAAVDLIASRLGQR